MASKLIVLRQRVASAFRAALNDADDEVSPVLAQRVEPFLEDGEEPFDFERLRTVLDRMIAASLEHLIETDKSRIDGLAHDGERRRQRNRAVTALRRKLIEVRTIAAGLFGRVRAPEVVAIEGRTAEQPEHLWRQGEHTLERLRDPEWRPLAASTSAIQIDRARLADELEPLVRELRHTTDTVEVDRRGDEASAQAKKEAMAEHDLLMGACGRILSGLYLLARRQELARHVRVTPPRRKRGDSSTA